MKSNEELSIDEFYLSKNLKRAGNDVGSLKGDLDDALFRAKKINHSSQFIIHRAIATAEETQRAIMLALVSVHDDDD